MSGQCLLCGYRCDTAQQCEAVPCCCWCRDEARELHAKEASALLKLEEIKPAFFIWSEGWQEDLPKRRESQPAKVFPGLQLYIGDMDDAADVQGLIKRRIGCVVNLCAERIDQAGYEMFVVNLARAGIHHHLLVAHDDCHFDIIAIAEYVIESIAVALRTSGVLVFCWAGCNRSAAVTVAYLTMKCGVPLFAAVEQSMKKRGTILTNQSFRKQLVRQCFKKGLNLEGSDVPAALMVAAEEDVAVGEDD